MQLLFASHLLEMTVEMGFLIGMEIPQESH